MNERNAAALEMRNKGKTFRYIGDVFGVSTERARQMVAAGKREVETANKAEGTPWLRLSTRTRNCILSELGWDELKATTPSPERVRELLNDGTISRNTPNLGKKCMGEIMQWLTDNGA